MSLNKYQAHNKVRQLTSGICHFVRQKPQTNHQTPPANANGVSPQSE
jgi:hypothetical protein